MDPPTKTKTISEFVSELDNVRKWRPTGKTNPLPTDVPTVATLPRTTMHKEIDKILSLLPSDGRTKREIAYALLGFQGSYRPSDDELNACWGEEEALDSVIRITTTISTCILDGTVTCN